MASSSVKSVQIKKINIESSISKADLLAVEEPLEIRLAFGNPKNRIQKSLAVTMRTPGNDFELVYGFLFSEGIIQQKADVVAIKYCFDKDKLQEQDNIVRVELHPDLDFDPMQFERHFYTNSSCGVCGKSSIESIASQCKLETDETTRIAGDIFYSLPDKLRASQQIFEHTGGIHACALFDDKGNLLMMREDVGRHNAMDKLIGAAFYKEILPLKNKLILLSGRCSFELVQKALTAGTPVVASVGAPSSLAVALAQQYNMSLLGFLKKQSYNIYTAKERIITNTNDN